MFTWKVARYVTSGTAIVIIIAVGQIPGMGSCSLRDLWDMKSYYILCFVETSGSTFFIQNSLKINLTTHLLFSDTCTHVPYISKKTV